jgi:hypothetical protein
LDADCTAALHARVAAADAAAAAAAHKLAAAEAQAAKSAADRHVRTLELNTLRDALRAMEATSDNKAALGKLHEEVLRLRAREVRALTGRCPSAAPHPSRAPRAVQPSALHIRAGGMHV